MRRLSVILIEADQELEEQVAWYAQHAGCESRHGSTPSSRQLSDVSWRTRGEVARC
jgi:hypothetical protein